MNNKSLSLRQQAEEFLKKYAENVKEITSIDVKKTVWGSVYIPDRVGNPKWRTAPSSIWTGNFPWQIFRIVRFCASGVCDDIGKRAYFADESYLSRHTGGWKKFIDQNAVFSIHSKRGSERILSTLQHACLSDFLWTKFQKDSENPLIVSRRAQWMPCRIITGLQMSGNLKMSSSGPWSILRKTSWNWWTI